MQGVTDLTLPKFLKIFNCFQRPALLSYFACFAGDRSFKSSDFKHFNVEKWWGAAEKFLKEHRFEPHPAVVAVAVRRSLSEAKRSKS